MFHKAVSLEFKEGTTLEVAFQDGKVMAFDMSCLFGKYPALRELRDRDLFLSGTLAGYYGIVWNDELDIETETIYQEGMMVQQTAAAPNTDIGNEFAAARAARNISQKQLSQMTGVDQADISRIERGISNPSVNTLKRIAEALDMKLELNLKDNRNV